MKLKALFTARDMTEGAPWKRIAEFAVPMLLGNLAQQLYNTADTVIVEAEEIVEIGEIAPEDVRTPGVFVDYVVQGGNY